MIIPADAVANPDGTYSWKDKQGKNWIFVKTPFGVMKTERSTDPAATTASLAGVKAFDEGDKVRFERPSPFGPMKWEKNKADLTDEERSLIDSQTSQPAGEAGLMMKTSPRLIALIVCAWALTGVRGQAPATPAPAQAAPATPAPAPQGTPVAIRFNFNGAALGDVIKLLAGELKLNYVLDPALPRLTWSP